MKICQKECDVGKVTTVLTSREPLLSPQEFLFFHLRAVCLGTRGALCSPQPAEHLLQQKEQYDNNQVVVMFSNVSC